MKSQMEEEGITHLRTAFELKKYNDIYGHLLASELRNMGRYTEALSIFEEVHKLKRSPVTRKNIQWLKKSILPEPTQY